MNWQNQMRVARKKSAGCHRAYSPGVAVLVHSLLLLMAIAAEAQEDIAPFRLTDVSGEFEARYLFDENRNDSANPATFISTPVWEEELLIRTRSYVYHPAFLQMNIGGGPLFVQSEFQSESGRFSDQNTLFNFDAAFSFLSVRPYPFTLHYRQSHPQISTGLSGSFLSTVKNYGIRGVLRPTKLPSGLYWDASHRDASGSGTGAVLDDETDRVSISTSLPYGDGNNLRFSFNWADTISGSGNVGLPVQQSQITNTGAQLAAKNFFGRSSDLSFRQVFTWLRQETLIATETQQDRINYTGNLLWDYSEKTNYNANLRYVDVERTGSWSRTGGARVGFRHSLSGGLSWSGVGNLSRSEAPGFITDAAGVATSVAYSRSLPFGTLTASARVGLRQTDQESAADTVAVFDEAVLLAGTNSVSLSQDFVVSVTVTVTNEAKTQSYIDGVDYRLFVTGGTTNIERLVTGNIADGQTVLVSYDFLTGGTVGYDSLTQNISLNLSTLKYASVYLGYNTVDNDISSGSALTPLNDSTSLDVGARVAYPVSQRWLVGGDYRFTDTDSDISSSISNRCAAYARVKLLSATSLQVGVQNTKVDNADSPEDVDRSGYTVNLSSVLGRGVRLSYSGRYSKDDGGSLFREEFRHVFRLDWGYRLVRFTLQADQSKVTQGGNEQTYKRVNARLTRYF
jgi:hypothetical protein